MRFSILLVGLICIAQMQGISQSSQPSAPNSVRDQFMASMTKMHAAVMSTAPAADSDLEFVQIMLPHHEAAIEMAKTQLLHGKDPQMKRLAQEIITDQQSEIELMQLWLKQHQSGTTNPAK